jgi:hypothetical protein
MIKAQAKTVHRARDGQQFSRARSMKTFFDASPRATPMVNVLCIGERYRKTMDANSVGHMPDRDPRVKSCKGLPMEEKRLDAASEAIAAV